jgi:predicted secreted protein
MGDLGLRGAASFVFALLVGVSVASAADRAEFNALGYSPDGQYFAFEQFGIQDGSGFPYSDIFIIDVATDAFAGGAPFRQRLDDETASLGDVRELARKTAQAAMVELGIDTPARLIALDGDGEPGREGVVMEFAIPGFGLADTHAAYELSLDIFKSESPHECVEWFGEEPMGFALYIAPEGEERIELHRDRSIPRTRNCTVTYRFYGVTIPFQNYGVDAAVAILSVWSRGFEGYDRRFIAIPVGNWQAP